MRVTVGRELFCVVGFMQQGGAIAMKKPIKPDSYVEFSVAFYLCSMPKATKKVHAVSRLLRAAFTPSYERNTSMIFHNNLLVVLVEHYLKLNPHTPVAKKVADEVVFRRLQGEGVDFFKSDLTDPLSDFWCASFGKYEF